MAFSINAGKLSGSIFYLDILTDTGKGPEIVVRFEEYRKGMQVRRGLWDIDSNLETICDGLSEGIKENGVFKGELTLEQ